jgi:hypothetical protein
MNCCKKTSSIESRNISRESHKSHCPNMHAIESHLNSSDYIENKYYFVAEFIWTTQAKLVACSSLKLIYKNQQEEMKFTFKVSKCVIFHEMLKNRYTKLSHPLSPLDELKHRAYCIWYSFVIHITNDCNVFCCQV